jgi:hypothetical protein
MKAICLKRFCSDSLTGARSLSGEWSQSRGLVREQVSCKLGTTWTAELCGYDEEHQQPAW